MKKTFLLFVSVVLLSCSGDGSSEDNSSNSGVVAFFKGKFSGQTFNYSQDDSQNPDYFQVVEASGCFSSSNDCVIDYGASMIPFDYDDTNRLRVGLTLYHLYNESDQFGESSQFHTLFAGLSTKFLTDSEGDDDSIKGLSVDYTTSDDKVYSTLYGNQNGSVITITSSVSSDENGVKARTISGTVSCKLYNYDNPSDVITLANGSFKLLFQEKGL